MKGSNPKIIKTHDLAFNYNEQLSVNNKSM